MGTAIRIILSILTLITFVACVYFTFLGFHIGQPILFVTGIALTIGFGVFVYADIRYWLNKLKAKPPVPPATK